MIGLAFAGFVSLGLPDGLLGVAAPSMRSTFAIAPDRFGVLLVSFTAGYLASSAASGALLARVGVGALLAGSCLLTAASLLVYATTSWWSFVVAFAAVSGLGAGAIDAGLNTWAAIHLRARGVSWLHAFYGVGATAGPIVMTAVLAAGRGWRHGYAVVGTAQLALAVAFAATRRRWPEIGAGARPTAAATANEAARAAEPARPASTLRLPHAWLGIAVFFLYTGLEAAVGVWAFSLLTGARGIDPVTAGLWLGTFWLGLTAGRVGFGAIVRGRPLAPLLRLSLAAIVAGTLLLSLDLGEAADFAGLALTGLAMAPIFPSLIATTPRRLGAPHAANGVGFQVAAASLGQSLIPAFAGVAVARFGLESIGPVLVGGSALLLALCELPGMRAATAAPEPIANAREDQARAGAASARSSATP